MSVAALAFIALPGCDKDSESFFDSEQYQTFSDNM